MENENIKNDLVVDEKKPVLAILDEIEDILEGASNVPLTSKVMVNKSEILDYISAARMRLPDSIKQADWILNERDNIMKEAEISADKILKEAEQKAAQLVSEDNIVKEAQLHAQDIYRNAQLESKNLKEGTVKYADELLMKTQKDLVAIIETLNENRRQLKSMDVKTEEE